MRPSGSQTYASSRPYGSLLDAGPVTDPRAERDQPLRELGRLASEALDTPVHLGRVDPDQANGAELPEPQRVAVGDLGDAGVPVAGGGVGRVAAAGGGDRGE